MKLIDYLKKEGHLDEGDTVELKSGGPHLVIDAITQPMDSESVFADVIWFSAGVLDHARVNVKCLNKVED